MNATTMKGGALLWVALAATHPVGAQSNAAGPRHERAVVPGAPGPNRLAIDVTLLAGGSPFDVVPDAGSIYSPGHRTTARFGLGELRLYDEQEREVPYLFVWPAEDPPRWLSGVATRITPGKDTSGFEVDLGEVARVDRLDITSLPERFLKRVLLEGSGDRQRWTQLVAEGTVFHLTDEHLGSLRQTELAFRPAEYRYLRVIWDDHRGGRLPLPYNVRVRVAPRNGITADTLRHSFAFEERPAARRTSRYHVRLPAAHLPIAAIELDVADGNVLRTARVTEQRLGAGRAEPVQLGTAQLRQIASPDGVASRLRIWIDQPLGSELDIVIENEDNPPLDVRGIHAVFSPLPFIYFDSPRGEPLRARYGVAGRERPKAPRYDLEVLRDSVRHIAAAQARWGGEPTEPTGTLVTAAGPALHVAPGAAVNVKTFLHARPIPPGEGLTAIRLDAAVLAHSRLDDVRIVDAQGRQVPYLFEVLDEPLIVALPKLEPTPALNLNSRVPVSANAPKATWYKLTLPYAGLPDATLRLRTDARVFSRNILIVAERTRPEARTYEAVSLGTPIWTHDDPDTPAPPLEIELAGRLETNVLYLAVNDGDNQPLPIAEPELLLPSYRLRFYREPKASLAMVYGRRDLAAPRYDLALIAPRLLDAPANEVALEGEGAQSDAAKVSASAVFWVVLAAVVVVLLLLIARLLRAGPRPDAEPVAE